MFKKHKAKKRKSKFSVRFLICFVLVVGMVSVWLVNNNIKYRELVQERSVIENENAELVMKKSNLTTELQNVNTDAYIESQARKELGMVKKNELVFIFDE